MLSILMLGTALVSGGTSIISPLVRMSAAGAGTYWAITYWADISRSTLNASRDVVALMIPGYSGPTTLFDMANQVFARVLTEHVAVSILSPSSWTDAVAAVFCGIFIWVGLSITGILAILAEFQLMIGAAAAPLILPALAFGFTSTIGWGAVTFLVSAGVRCVVMGVVSFVMANAVTTIITVPGTDAGLSHSQVATLMGVSLLTALAGICCNSIARDLVTGSPGSLGWGSVVRTAGVIGVGASAATKEIGGASTRAGAAGGAGGTGGRVQGGGQSAGSSAAGSAGGKVGVSSGIGSAFP